MQGARLVVQEDEGAAREVALGERTQLGRAPENDVVVVEAKVSRQHALIALSEDGYTLSDLGSANGTFLNGRRLLTPALLRSGDVLRIGSASLTFVHDAGGAEKGLEAATDETQLGSVPDGELAVLGTSPAMVEVFRLIAKATASRIPVLIEGETGTGKELVARGIHLASARADRPFLAINCGALPETLLESELFGHRRGAFTGAAQERRGLFEAASGGTVFLDEVGEMPPAMQIRLLRVLQEGEVTPLGDNHPRKVDVRVISATNRDLLAEVERGAFRGDLYYRLAAFPVALPALRDRREDIPLLASRFVAAAAQLAQKRVSGIEPEALDALAHFDWPGNVRELRNEIQRAVTLARSGDRLGLVHLSPKLKHPVEARARATSAPADEGAAAPPGVAAQAPPPVGQAPEAPTVKSPLRDARARFEARYIAEVLRQEGGSVTRAARALGLSRVALHRKMKEYHLR